MHIQPLCAVIIDGVTRFPNGGPVLTSEAEGQRIVDAGSATDVTEEVLAEQAESSAATAEDEGEEVVELTPGETVDKSGAADQVLEDLDEEQPAEGAGKTAADEEAPLDPPAAEPKATKAKK